MSDDRAIIAYVWEPGPGLDNRLSVLSGSTSGWLNFRRGTLEGIAVHRK